MTEKSSLVISDLPCIMKDCNSSDAMSVYDDKHAYCFSCHKSKPLDDEKYEELINTPGGNKPKRKKLPMTKTNLKGEFKRIPDRGISPETCEIFGVKTQKNGEGIDASYVLPTFDKDDNINSVKLKKINPKEGEMRYVIKHAKDKSYRDAMPFGMQVAKRIPSKKYLTITEGEMDALAVSQIFGNKYAVISVKDGAGSAVRDVKDWYEFINTYENVVVCFDADEPGRKAAKEVAKILPPRKAKIVHLGDTKNDKEMKDPCEYLGNREAGKFMDRWWGAETYTPDGIISANNMWERLITKKETKSVKYPFETLNKITYGMRLGEVTTIIAPTGVGKTAFCRQVGYEIIKNTSHNVGFLMLEDTVDDTTLGLMSIHSQRPLHLPDKQPSQDELRTIFDSLYTENPDRVYMYDSFGSADLEVILDKINYFSQALDCKYIFLDHLSIIVSDQRHGDERKALDEIATKLKKHCIQNGVHLMQVSHINRDGEIRGTAAIEQLSNIVIRLERDKKHKDEKVRNTTVLTCEKNRFCGITGPAGYLKYDLNRAILEEIPEEEYLEEDWQGGDDKNIGEL